MYTFHILHGPACLFSLFIQSLTSSVFVFALSFHLIKSSIIICEISAFVFFLPFIIVQYDLLLVLY